MKLFHHCLATIGLFGTTVIGASLIGSSPAQAIPEAQVIAKLQNIPVYVITDDKGTIVEARISSQGKNPSPQVSTGVFFTEQDARTFVEKNLKLQQPELGKVVKVTPVSLGEIYRRQQANKNKPQELNYVYVPTAQQSSSALAILNRSGQKLTQINGSPVFIATVKSKSGKDEYLTFQRDNREIVPIFFSEVALRASIKKVYPNLTSKINIQVVELNDLLGYMTSKNDAVISAFEFNSNMENK
jgi:Tic22-like family